MRRLSTVLLALLMVTACSDDDGEVAAVDPATTTSAASSIVTTTTAGNPTTAAPAVTRTTFAAPPATLPNPERGPFVGIWRWANTHTRYIQMFDHGVIGAGAIVESVLEVSILGEWDVVDGVMTITSLQIGPDSCTDDGIGRYEIRISGSNLVMDVIEDPCEGRTLWLLGTDDIRRTWLPADAGGP